MRHYSRRFSFIFFAVVLVTSSFAHPQQPWSSILNQSRAIDWSKAGLPATLPDGETTPNPWTPPTRPACTSAQAGITVPVPSGTSFSSIVSAMHNCSVANPTGSYLQLGPGSFTLSSTMYLNSAPYVTLRGSGPMSTTLTFSGSSAKLQFGQGGSRGGGALSANPAAGTSSVTLTGVSGSTPTVGSFAWFQQCDTGWTGTVQPTQGYNNCTTGSYADNGAIYVCGGNSACNQNGSGSGAGGQTSQQQNVMITSVTNNGGGSYTIGFSPGLYLPNWSTARTAAMYWQTDNVAKGIGFEDMTVVYSASQSLELIDTYASWIKGVRFIGQPSQQVFIAYSKNSLFSNNYLFGSVPSSMNGNTLQVVENYSSDNLVLNNIAEQGLFMEGHGSEQGEVIAYNFSQNVTANYVQSTDYQHDNFSSGVAFILNEGNQVNSLIDDGTWGTGDLNTFFRNWASCGEPPYVHSSITGSGIAIDSFHRFDNAVGNVVGGTAQCNSYSGTATGGEIWRVNKQGTDSLTATSFLRWYNYDTVTASTKCDPSEVPTSLGGNAAPFANSVPANCSAPASFYMNSMSFHPSGGTGLSWWKVCSSGFNASTGTCGGSSTTQPFPTAGPDVTGGNTISGHVYDNPAHLAWRHLPIDTSLQNHYTITGSSWSGGTETLTVSGLPGNLNDILGSFQISGGACATVGAGTETGAEVTMTGSTTGSVSYALASNPGTCTGTMLWPDVRQFDERVYQTDASQIGQSSGPEAPIDLTSTVQ